MNDECFVTTDSGTECFNDRKTAMRLVRKLRKNGKKAKFSKSNPWEGYSDLGRDRANTPSGGMGSDWHI